MVSLALTIFICMILKTRFKSSFFRCDFSLLASLSYNDIFFSLFSIGWLLTTLLGLPRQLATRIQLFGLLPLLFLEECGLKSYADGGTASTFLEDMTGRIAAISMNSASVK
jgi:hypothetical protein